jgi:hypothetical protein
LSLLGCEICGLVQINSVVDPELIYRNYLYKSNISLGLKEHFEKYAVSLVEKIKLEKESFVVEIGCNDAILLKELKKLKMRVLGFEPAIKIAAENNEQGVNTIPEFFSKEQAELVAQKHGKAGLIVANNVMANIDDLKSIMLSMKGLLSEKGSIVIESGYYIDTLDGVVVDNVYHEHYSYLGVKSIDYLCRETGLSLYGVEHVKTKGGSMRYYIGKNKARVSDKIQQYIEKEDSRISQGLYNEIASPVKKSVSLVCHHIEKMKRAGKKVSAYGASVGAVTLQYLYGLDKGLECFYDDNEIKKGMCGPSSGVLVKDSSDIYNDEPDAIIIFCWRYAEKIIERHQNYLNQGGVFIVPLPEMLVVEGSALEA